MKTLADNPEAATALPLLTGPWTFVGDVHGHFDELPLIGPTIQVGDLGIGFISEQEDERELRWRDDFWFIRGNHDNPALCQKHPRYLGDWGRHECMFWVGGAWSIDKNFRVEGVSWWREEELSAAQGEQALADYLETKPRVMVTHDGPRCLFEYNGPMEIWRFRPSSTANLLQAMFEAHQPEVWLFGHHHQSEDFHQGGSHFRCLNIEESLTLTFHPDGTIEWPPQSSAEL